MLKFYFLSRNKKNTIFKEEKFLRFSSINFSIETKFNRHGPNFFGFRQTIRIGQFWIYADENCEDLHLKGFQTKLFLLSVK